MRTRMSGGVRGVRSNADPISIIVIRRFLIAGKAIGPFSVVPPIDC